MHAVAASVIWVLVAQGWPLLPSPIEIEHLLPSPIEIAHLLPSSIEIEHLLLALSSIEIEPLPLLTSPSSIQIEPLPLLTSPSSIEIEPLPLLTSPSSVEIEQLLPPRARRGGHMRARVAWKMWQQMRGGEGEGGEDSPLPTDYNWLLTR